MAEISQILKTVAFPSLTRPSSQGGNASAFDVNKIRNALNTYNFQKNNLGQVFITIPSLVAQRYPSYNNKVEMMSLYSEAFNIPSMGMATNEIRRYGEGPTSKHGYLPLNVDVNLSLICDGRGIIHSFFYNWMKSIVRANDRNLNGETAEFSYPFEVSYYNDYTTTIALVTYNEVGEVTMTTYLYNAFPVFVSDVQFNWNSSNDLARLNITMTYEYANNFYNEDSFDKPSPNRKDNLSTLQKIVKAATAVQALSTLRKPRSIGDILNVTNNTANIFKAF